MKFKTIILITLLFIVLPLKTIAQNSTTKVFLIIGQSNAAGRGKLPEELIELDNVMVLNNQGEFQKATPVLNNFSSIRDTNKEQGYNLGYTFGQAMYDNTGDQIKLIVNARGGSSIDTWETTNTSQNYYGEAITRTKIALEETNTELAGIIWHQGESNYARANYITQLTSIIEGFRTEFNNPNLPFIAGEISYENKNYLNFNYDLISKLPSSVINTAVVSAEGLTTVPEDEIHFNALSQQILGKRYAIEMLRQLGYNEENIHVDIPKPREDGITHFTPDPDKEYYIQSVSNMRLTANGNDNVAFSSSNTTIDNTSPWKFINSGNDGTYFIQLASGGNKPRLQSNSNGNATMLTTNSSGGWTQFLMEERTYGEGVYHITTPSGPNGKRRLYLDSLNGIAGMYDLTNKGDECTFTIIEVNSALSIKNIEQIGLSSTPNPFTDKLTILGINNNTTIYDIQIFNSNGSILKTPVIFQKKNIQISTENLTNGIYFLHITTEEGVFVNKIIK